MSSLSGVELTQQDVYTSSATQQHRLGMRGVLPGGRVFRYCLAGGADLNPGQLAVVETVTANHVNIVVAAAVAVGGTSITATLGASAVTLNQYAEGYLVVNDAAGEGIAYRILGHPAADASAVITVTIAAPGVRVALTTASEVSLISNEYEDVVISVTDQADQPVGVPNVTITTAQYGWLQTWGMCSVLADETITAGQAITAGTGAAGAVEAVDLAGEVQVGIANQAAVDTEYRAVYLTLAP